MDAYWFQDWFQWCPLTKIKGDLMEDAENTAIIIGNNIAVNRVVSDQLSKKYDMMYSQRTYVHWCVGEGLGYGRRWILRISIRSWILGERLLWCHYRTSLWWWKHFLWKPCVTIFWRKSNFYRNVNFGTLDLDVQKFNHFMERLFRLSIKSFRCLSFTHLYVFRVPKSESTMG